MKGVSDMDVRMATPGDREELARVFHEVDLHYWGEAAPERAVMRAHVLDTLLGPNAGCDIAVAVRDGRVLGLATFAVLYPAPELGGNLYMKDLFTLGEARSQGVGRAIMTYLARLAVARGCDHFDWTTEAANSGALAFYDRLGAARVKDRVYFRLDGEGLRNLAGAGNGDGMAS
jgi:ribosomal protein S18 acetylase RimI-like enzyme